MYFFSATKTFCFAESVTSVTEEATVVGSCSLVSTLGASSLLCDDEATCIERLISPSKGMHFPSLSEHTWPSYAPFTTKSGLIIFIFWRNSAFFSKILTSQSNVLSCLPLSLMARSVPMVLYVELFSKTTFIKIGPQSGSKPTE